MFQYIVGIISIIVSFSVIIKFLSWIKNRNIDDLWNAIQNYTLKSEEGLINKNLLNTELTGNKERLINIVEYCNLHLINVKTKKPETLSKLRQFKNNAERLQKWFVIFLLF